MKKALLGLAIIVVLFSTPCFADSYHRLIKFDENITQQLFERTLHSIIKRNNFRLISYDRKAHKIEAVCSTAEVAYTIFTLKITAYFHSRFKFDFQTVNARTILTFDGDTGHMFDVVSGPERMRTCFDAIFEPFDVDYTYNVPVKKAVKN